MTATETIHACVIDALARAERCDAPYRHWIIDGFMPSSLVDDVRSFNAPAPDLGGVSGKRELHNDQRTYFNADTIPNTPSIAAIANAFQDAALVAALAVFFDADLDKTFLRIEYACDVTGFWLQPHTDLGVKRLTILHYISDEPDQGDLGTDIYNADKSWAARTPFAPNAAMAFKPDDNTYHGFEARPIAGLRKSLIINYVTDDWRDRSQLAFPDEAVRVG